LGYILWQDGAGLYDIATETGPQLMLRFVSRPDSQSSQNMVSSVLVVACQSGLVHLGETATN